MSKKIIAALAFAPFLCVAKNEELAEFDFCGIPDSLRAVGNYGSHVSGTDLPMECQRFLNDTVHRYALGLSLMFQGCLSAAEVRACSGDGESYRSTMNTVGDMLRFLMKNERVVGKSVFNCNLARTESSLARVINGQLGRSIEVCASDIKRWLPEIEANESRDRCNLNRFKTLLLIGAAIEQYRRVHNRLPENLNVLVGEKGLGISESDLSFGNLRVEYRIASDFWKLRLGSYERRAPEPIYDFVPAVYQVAGVVVDEVWFASTYTQKRKELFDNGHLQSEDPYCRCRLKGCIVMRGGTETSSLDESSRDYKRGACLTTSAMGARDESRSREASRE